MSGSASEPPKSPADRVTAAEQLREAANDKFRKGDVAAARADYEQVLRLLLRQKDPLKGPGPAPEFEGLEDRWQACRLPTLLNLALCFLKAEPCEAGRALEVCEEALDLDPDNAKASYRKAKALVEMGEEKEAEWELARACRLAPSDAAPRRDLEALRRRLKAQREEQRRTFEGLFERNPGFASEGRETGPAASGSAGPQSEDEYPFFRQPAENPFLCAAEPHREATGLQATGRLEEAIWAWEAAIHQTMVGGNWPAYFANWLELARLFMDLNFDAAALRCLKRPVEGGSPAAEGRTLEPPVAVRCHALLLRSICIVNEVEDPQAEVTSCLEAWLTAIEGSASIPALSSTSGHPLEERLGRWRREDAVGSGADAAVAHGMWLLVHGRRDEALTAFAAAVAAQQSEESCFGSRRRRSTRWNMLGAVLSNCERRKEALIAYEQALKLQPFYPRALTNQSIALQALRDPVGAARSVANALRIVPDWASEGLWQMLRKAADEQSSISGLADAAEERSLVRAYELLGLKREAQTAEEEGMESASALLKSLTAGI